jgi:hypothetical protein
MHVFLAFSGCLYLLSRLIELPVAYKFHRKALFSVSSASVLSHCLSVLVYVRLGLKKMHAQYNLPRRATAAAGGAAHGGYGAAAHGGYGADVGDGEVLSVGHPGGVAGGDVAAGGGRVHSPPFDRDVEVVIMEHNAVGMEHSVLVHRAAGGPVPGPALPMNAMAAPRDGKCCVSFFVYDLLLCFFGSADQKVPLVYSDGLIVVPISSRMMVGELIVKARGTDVEYHSFF